MSVIAFRAYGKLCFHRPGKDGHKEDYPKQGNDWTSVLAGNVLEIGYARKAGGLRAFARVFPWAERHDEANPGHPPPDDAANIFKGGGLDVVCRALTNTGTASFWAFDPGSGPTPGTRIRFAGLVTLDEFRGEPGKQSFDRIPVLLSHPGERGYTSFVTFGDGWSRPWATDQRTFDFRIELGVPIPSSTKEPAAIVFGGVFASTINTDRSATSPTHLTCGPPGPKKESERTPLKERLPLSQLGRQFGNPAPTDWEKPIAPHVCWPRVPGPWLQSMGLPQAGAYAWERVEFLVGSKRWESAGSADPYFAVAVQVSAPGQCALALLGAGGPAFNARDVEIEILATASLPDIAIHAAITASSLSSQTAELVWSIRLAIRFPNVAGGVIDQANLAALRSREALLATRGQPQSALPDVLPRHDAPTNDIACRFVSILEPVEVRAAAGEVLRYPERGPYPCFTTLDDTPTLYDDLAPRGQDWSFTRDRGTPVDVRVILPSLGGYEGGEGPPELPLRLRSPPPGSGERRASELVLVFQGPDDAKYTASLGSMALGREGAPLEGAATLVLRPAARPVAGRRQPDIDWRLALKLDAASPVTVDRPTGRGEERPNDLLIYEDREDQPGGAHAATPALELHIVEEFADGRDRMLEAKIYDTSTDDSSTDTITVLLDQPFSLFRYRRERLTAAGRDDKALVAEYNSQAQQWIFKSVAPTYRLVRQAGAIGEDADKPGMLELHDAPDGSRSPIPARNGHDGIGPSRRIALDMRLSPPTTLWVRPNDLGGDDNLPEFAAYEYFRALGALGPGVPLAGLRGEALYGLAFGAHVVPGADDGGAPRVAEIDALVGKLPIPSEHKAVERHEAVERPDKWPELLSTLRKRAEHLMIFRLDPQEPHPFAPARIARGAHFALRQTALLAPPAKNWQDPERTSGAEVAPPRFGPDGLAGGAIWPIESANVARLVANNPIGTDGELDGMAISPMGITARQAVRFVNGAVRIMSETVEGRLQRQRVEILGRIGVFCHRARHVILYERTTAATLQFAPAARGTRSNRAVIRKVSEFIEILEPERRFPDNSAAQISSRGFLTAVRFNSRIIHVDSAWGREVGEVGWEVPLWNRGAAVERPQVYPQPDIAFITRSEGLENEPESPQECRDPHLLFFFTDTAAIAAQEIDTDRWPAREGVDGTILSARSLWPGDEGTGDEGTGDEGKARARQPTPSRLLPGLRRFTWRLTPLGRRTQINTGFGNKPIYASVESVTVCRNIGGPPDSKSETLKPGLGGIRDLGKLPPPDLARLPRPWSPESELGRTLTEVYEELKRTGDAPDRPEHLKRLSDRITKLVGDGWPKRAVEDIVSLVVPDGRLGEIVEKVQRGKAVVDLVIAAEEADCEKLADRTAAALRRRELTIVETIRSAETELIAELDKFPSKAALQEQVRKHLLEEVGGLTTDLAVGIGRVQDGLALTRSIVADWRGDALAGLARARARVAEVRAAYEEDKPWSIHRLNGALKELTEVFDAAEREVGAALNEARHRLATELGSTARALAGVVSATIQHAIDEIARQGAELDTVRRVVEGLCTQLAKAVGDSRRALAELGDAATRAGGEAAEAWGRLSAVVAAFNTAADKSASQIQALRELATGGLDGIRDAVSRVIASIEGLQQAVTPVLEGLEASANAALRELAERALAVLKDWTDEALTENLKRIWGQATTELAFLDQATDLCFEHVDAWGSTVETATRASLDAADQWLARVQRQAETAGEALTNAANDALRTLVRQAVDRAFDEVDWPPGGEVQPAHATKAVRGVSGQFQQGLATIDAKALSALEAAEEACKRLVGANRRLVDGADEYQNELKTQLEAQLTKLQSLVDQALGPDPAKAEAAVRQLAAEGKVLLDTAEGIAVEAATAQEHARAYLQGGLERAEALLRKGGGPAALPGRALELVSFLSHSPEIAGLRTNVDRVRAHLNQAEQVLDTPTIRATVNRLGDALKTMGLDFDFESFGDEFKFREGPSRLLRDLIPDFGGLKLRDLLGTASVPDVGRHVRVGHDLDARTGRAWLRVDINLPLPERHALFSVGPFALYLANSHFIAFQHAEASKDSPDTSISDQATLHTDLEFVVSGQLLLSIREVMITYSRERQLECRLDPRKIRLHQAMRFIGDTLGSALGDLGGGLSWIKDGERVVGVEHSFVLPPLSLNYATSGISNLQLANRFSLRAFPDFVLANRFNLSRRDLPFIFSIFIIGGAGYLQVETEYRPADREIQVAVEAGLGGSAAFAFAFGPVSGGVYISLVVVLRYTRRIGASARADDGLTVSLVLLIAGHVSLWGMVTVYLGLMLTMSYHDSGQIDATGQLTVEVRVSRFFKLKYASVVTYKLRDGHATTTRISETSTDDRAAKALTRARELNKARMSL